MIKEEYINNIIPHDSAYKHVDGSAEYTDDIIEPEQTLFGAIGWSKKSNAVINKIDLAEMVGANLEIMDKDTSRMRGNKPWCFTNLQKNEGLDQVVNFLYKQIPN